MTTINEELSKLCVNIKIPSSGNVTSFDGFTTNDLKQEESVSPLDDISVTKVTPTNHENPVLIPTISHHEPRSTIVLTPQIYRQLTEKNAPEQITIKKSPRFSPLQMPSNTRQLQRSALSYSDTKRNVKSANATMQRLKRERDFRMNNRGSLNSPTISAVQCFDLSSGLEPNSPGWVPYRLSRAPRNAWSPLPDRNNPPSTFHRTRETISTKPRPMRPATTALYHTKSNSAYYRDIGSDNFKLNVIDLNQLFNASTHTTRPNNSQDPRRMDSISFLHSHHMNSKTFENPQKQRAREYIINRSIQNRPRSTYTYRQRKNLIFTDCMQVNKILMPSSKNLSHQ